MVLTKDGYRPRLVDPQVDFLLKAFGALCIEGPKSCGKTWVALNHSDSAIMIGDPSNNYSNRKKVMVDIYSAFEGSEPHLIDEWQEIPSLWDATKYKVDETTRLGRFILTGSSTPIMKGVFHSGAGRIGTMRMTTMSLFESGDSDGSVSLRSLFDLPTIRPRGNIDVDLEKLIYLTARGGWPKNLGMAGPIAIAAVKGYVDTIVKDASRLDGDYYDTKKTLMVIKSLARNESTLASNTRISSDVCDTVDNNELAIDSGLNYKTTCRYLNALDRLFITNDQPAFSPNFRSPARVGKRCKRHLVDPSIAVAALDLSEKKLLSDLNTFGFLFEALCERDLGIYANANGGKLYHYRDELGHEIDAVVELDDGRWGAFEIKLGAYQIDDAAEKLIATRDWMVAKGVKNPPTLLCVICGVENVAYKRTDGVYVVPITALRN